MLPPLFDRHPVGVVIPDVDGAARLRAHLEHERAEFDIELGGPITFVPGDRPSLRFIIDPGIATPTLRRAADGNLDAIGATLDDATQALHLLRTMRRQPAAELHHRPAVDAATAIERVEHEVAVSWPSFGLTGIDWVQVSENARPDVGAPGLIAALQRWVAHLGDAHTSVVERPDMAALPYRARVAADGSIVVVEVPDESVASSAGVRAGDRIIGVDTTRIGARFGASAHMHPWMVARRALSGIRGDTGSFTVRTVGGDEIVFEETFGDSPQPPPVEWHRRPETGTAYLRIRRWGDDDVAALDTAFTEIDGADRLLVDLRGNVGGSLMAAVGFRRRFIDRRTRMGSIQFSTGDGGLGPSVDLVDEPADSGRWGRRVRFLTDPLTYSASEDALLGLRQLPHVDIVGQRSGGGSGRQRTVPLTGNSLLVVSTALTYCHDGSIVEGSGLPVDHHLANEVLTPEGADRLW